jgi:hypothetical protein
MDIRKLNILICLREKGCQRVFDSVPFVIGHRYRVPMWQDMIEVRCNPLGKVLSIMIFWHG